MICPPIQFIKAKQSIKSNFYDGLVSPVNFNRIQNYGTHFLFYSRTSTFNWWFRSLLKEASFPN